MQATTLHIQVVIQYASHLTPHVGGTTVHKPPYTTYYSSTFNFFGAGSSVLSGGLVETELVRAAPGIWLGTS